MSAQLQSNVRPDAEGIITYIDNHGDVVKMAAHGIDTFQGLRHAGGEAFVPKSDDEESSEGEHVSYSPQYHGVPMYAYAPSTSSKKSKKDKKSKKSKKERSPEYIVAPAPQAQGACCSCGNHRH